MVDELIALPETLPGHWNTVDGCQMARSYAGKSRDQLCMGHLSDLEVANGVFMADRSELDLISWQTAAKQRIRWLSAQLALANTRIEPEAADRGVPSIAELPEFKTAPPTDELRRVVRLSLEQERRDKPADRGVSEALEDLRTHRRPTIASLSMAVWRAIKHGPRGPDLGAMTHEERDWYLFGMRPAPMTDPVNAGDDLVERLNAYDHSRPKHVPTPGRGFRTCYPLVNPDGPEAADQLTVLTAALREARVILKARGYGDHTAVITQIDAALTGEQG